ncbi:hypothetical protein BH09BAC4_BH09BAC4_28690 [soil metagenome]
MSSISRTTDDPRVIQSMIPPVLYKYRLWNKASHKTILTQRQLYFSSAYDFDDDKDCRFLVKHDLTYEHVEAFYRHHKRNWTEEQIQAFARYMFKDRFGTPEKITEFKDNFYHYFNEAFGILSLCRQNNLVRRWSEYADEFNGFCVGFSLGEHTDDLHDNQIFVGPIDYVPDDQPPLNYFWEYQLDDTKVTEFFVRLITTKYEKYRFEDEFRLGKYFFQKQAVQKHDRLYIVPKTAYQEIIFGYKMPKIQAFEIIAESLKMRLNVHDKIARPDHQGNVILDDISIPDFIH